MGEFAYAIGSHPGLVRECNEDSYLALPELGVWAVADGMGGHEAGEVASAITIHEIANRVKEGMALSVAINSAHRAIQNAVLQGEGSEGMGSTIAATKLNGTGYEIVWVGDSRAYLWNGTLKQLTKDHSYVQLLLDAGLIDESQIAEHPSRNVISQALGTGGLNDEGIKPGCVTGQLGDGETLLLCSDGLTGELSDQEIAAILSESTDNQTKVDRLIEAALAAGGNDNVTVLVISHGNVPITTQ